MDHEKANVEPSAHSVDDNAQNNYAALRDEVIPYVETPDYLVDETAHESFG